MGYSICLRCSYEVTSHHPCMMRCHQRTPHVQVHVEFSDGSSLRWALPWGLFFCKSSSNLSQALTFPVFTVFSSSTVMDSVNWFLLIIPIIKLCTCLFNSETACSFLKHNNLNLGSNSVQRPNVLLCSTPENRSQTFF